MAYIIRDFECGNCGAEWDDLVDKNDQTSECPECGTVAEKPVLSAPALATFSMMSPAQRAAHLKQRSEKHTNKEIAKEAEAFGEVGIQRARKDKIQVGYRGKKSAK